MASPRFVLFPGRCVPLSAVLEIEMLKPAEDKSRNGRAHL